MKADNLHFEAWKEQKGKKLREEEEKKKRRKGIPPARQINKYTRRQRQNLFYVNHCTN